MVNRISGLSSGIDYDTIIKKMMDAQRIPMNKLNKQKQLLEWKRDDYRTLNTKVLEFKNAAFDMTLQSAYLSKKVSSSNEAAVTVTGTASASNGQYTLEVGQLAEAGSFKSGVLDNKSTLADMGISSQTEFIVGGAKGTAGIVIKPTDTLDSFITNVNAKSASTGVKATYDENLKTMFFVSSQTGEKSNITLRLNGATDIDSFFGLANANNTSTNGQIIKSPGEKQFFNTTDVIDSTLVGTKKFEFKYNGTNHSFDITSSTKIGDLINQINTKLHTKTTSNKSLGLEASLNSSGRLVFTNHESATKALDFTGTDSSTQKLLGLTGVKFDSQSILIDRDLKTTETFKMQYDGKEYKYDINGTTTIGQLINNINIDLGKTGVSAYLSSDGKLSFNNPDGAKALTFNGTTTDTLKKISMDGPISPQTISYSTVSSKDVGQTAGKDAEITFNGVSAKYDSNTFTIAGMNITAKQTTTAKVNIGVTQDVDKAYDSIKKFVDKYNELIDLVNKETGEKRYRDFEPLTDEEKDGMSEKEIERWEEKARSGTLANDQTLASGLRSLRRSLSDTVTGIADGQFKSLAQLGISNTNVSGGAVSGSYEDQGKLYIDESKLKAALAEDPDSVMELFTKSGDSSASKGVAVRLNDEAQRLFNQITEKAGVTNALEDKYSIGKETKRINEQITAWTRRLEDMEKRYYAQFTRMESYIGKMNTQSNYLTQQFSTGG